ncbi:MAG: glycosyltransferase [Symploca sp. SIO2E9]|nr:glycosyltransferase [Symploca sp. SIO2E9]
MLFELSVGGHYPIYIMHLVRYWHEQELPGRLDIVVSPKFIQQHSAVVDLASVSDKSNINFIAITPEEEASISSRIPLISRVFRKFQEWHLLCKYAKFLKATQCLIMFFDIYQIPLALGTKFPCSLSGIYFRPSFHYGNFANHPSSEKERLQKWWEKFLLSVVLHHPQLRTLFCLDPFVVEHINKLSSKTKAVHLPDPVQISDNPEFQLEKFRENLGIQPGRQVFLLFGTLTKRKGLHRLLEAIPLLSATLSDKFCLLLVGKQPSDQAAIKSQIAEIMQSQPVQIISHYEFVPEQDVYSYFQVADVVLAIHQRHVGMSGTLVLAAAAQKPVLSSNYGLIGEIVQHHSLGLTVDSTLHSEIAKGLTQFLLNSPAQFCNSSKMKLFSEHNSAEKFASIIFRYV